MIHAIVISTWRVQQAKAVKEFIIAWKQKHDDREPTVEQIRNKLHNLRCTLDDFVLQLGVDVIKYLSSHQFARRSLMNSSQPGTSIFESMNDSKLTASLNKLKQWPLNSHRVKKFEEITELKILRRYHSRSFQHLPSKIKTERKRRQVICSLCSTSKCKSQTAYECSSCRVPLCVKKSRDGSRSCFDVWHDSEDLKAAHQQMNAALRNRKRSRSTLRSTTVDEDLDDDNNSYSFLNDSHLDEDDGGMPCLPPTDSTLENATDDRNTQMSMDEVEGGSWSPINGDTAEGDGDNDTSLSTAV